MSMMRAIGLLGVGAEGFMEGRREEEEAQRRRQDQAWQQEQRAYAREQMLRARQGQQELDAAGAPVVAQPAAPDPSNGVVNDEEGNPMPPQGPMATVQGQRMGAGQAPAAVAAANDPEAVQQRQLAVLQRIDPAKAAAMQLSVTAQRAAKMKAANDEFDNGLNQAAGKGWDALTEFMSNSGAHPAKSKFVPNPDGKTGEVHIVQPDGSLKPTGMTFPNTPEGALEAAGMLSRSTPLTAKVAHVVAERRLALQDKRDTEAAKARERHDAIMDRYYTGLIDSKNDKNDNDAAKGAAKMSDEDKAELGDIHKQLEVINSKRVEAQAGGMWQKDSDGAKAIAKQEAGLIFRRDKILGSYRTSAAPADKLGVRGGGESTTTTRPMTPDELIEKDMKERGVTDATSTIREGGKTRTTVYGKGSPAAAAPPPKPTAGMQAAMGPLDDAGKALDAARGAFDAAQERLMTYGSKQKQADPKGFAAAQAAVDAAKAARDKADAEYKAAVAAQPQQSAAFGRYPAP